ncbi:PDZ domain (Also known as DHR or GLGF) [Nesidiocoris tenuis]|uniref:PDZ domain (Also known as DHR or GLGF) n=1 Tax=Nesidiocoris tenuis TaxID=355587 RepID=A0ABN7AEE2_9HEMI|nr:PDZ domain (Also known as DHR or GLGF) [Nesidiocoris tenuis]
MSVVDSMLEIQHKRQQSHDSGTYQDWPLEDQKETNYNSNVTGEFVTVVAVDTSECTPSPVENPFVTVLSIDSLSQPDHEEVLVYRLPGERLGFGLKFEGGVKTAEKVGKLYIQSCAVDSPASRTSASWGPLGPGDQIVGVDGVLVSDMTRIDCVRALKESNVVIKLLVRHGADPKLTKIRQSAQECQAPPIPPRKFPRKKESPIDPPQGFDDKKNSPPVMPRSRTNVPQAEVYTDLLSQESLAPGESESDDTGSSISTVVSRISSTPTTSNSSFSDVRSITSMDAAITSPPTPTTTNTPFDLDRVLEPFLQLEREFSSNTIDQNKIFTKLVEASNLIGTQDESTLKPPENFQDGSGDVQTDVDPKEAPELPPKPSPRHEMDKKRRPPPPPPRSDRPVCPDPAETEETTHQSHDLPRLIDFVPKDCNDVVAPGPNFSNETTSTKPV